MLKHWVILAAAVGFTGAAAHAQDRGAVPPRSRPMLEQLDREAQDLYEEVRQEMVRVEMPVPSALMELMARENPVIKWGGQLDERVRQQLEKEQNKALSGRAPSISAEVAAPTESPSTAPSATTQSASPSAAAPTTQGWRLVAIPTGQQDAQGRVGMTLSLRPADERPATTQYAVEARAKVNTAGIILDADGYVVVPLYLDREAAEQPNARIIVYGAGGAVSRARFIASDSKMNLTVLQLEKKIGRPANVDDKRPTLGSVVMIVTPNQSTAKLAVWTGGFQEFGIVCGLDGKIDGFVRYGQFLSAPMWGPVVKQLIDNGQVRRAVLGVVVQQIYPEDPIRQEVPALGDRPAIQVRGVTPGSAAAKGGIRAGDFILRFDNKQVEDVPGFAAAIAELSGEKEIEVLREGAVTKVKVTLVPQ